MNLRLCGLIIFSISFAGIFLLNPATWYYPLCIVGIISNLWIDYFATQKEKGELDKLIDSEKDGIYVQVNSSAKSFTQIQ